MSTFFRQTAQAMIAKHIDRFPLLKLDQVIDWQPIEQYLNRQRTRYLRDHRGRPAYPLLYMFKAVLNLSKTLSIKSIIIIGYTAISIGYDTDMIASSPITEAKNENTQIPTHIAL